MEAGEMDYLEKIRQLEQEIERLTGVRKVSDVPCVRKITMMADFGGFEYAEKFNNMSGEEQQVELERIHKRLKEIGPPDNPYTP